MSVDPNKEGEFNALLKEHWSDLPDEKRQKIVQFRSRVVMECRKQNLTKLLEPKDFLDGHVLDVKELTDWDFIEYPALDLGSGCGVPGIIGSIVQERPWILAESETSKSNFLKQTVAELGLKNVMVFPGRAEIFFKSNAVNSVVAKAVAPIDRIYRWLRGSSTWNKLVLLKGPKWNEEWEKFASTGKGKELQITETHRYGLYPGEPETRLIIQLKRK
jgi:16S rRNA (guanine(527)-N(7))-methyltransferase RsmG